MVRVSVLMDDAEPERAGLLAQHGLSYLLEGYGMRLLFDCGAGAGMLENARSLGHCLKDLDAVVLSHGHYDHAGGYRPLIEQGLGSRLLYTGPDFLTPRFSCRDNRCTDLSAGFTQAFLREHRIMHRQVEGLYELVPGMWIVGTFPRVYAYETIPSRFQRLTKEGFVPDSFEDEICLVMDTAGGLAVFAGCAHPGILNMTQQVGTLLKRPIYGVFGGLHLAEASEERLDATMQKFRAMGVKRLGLGHCSGEAVRDAARLKGLSNEVLAAGDCLFLEDRHA